MWASAHLTVVFVFSLCHRLLAGCEVVLLSLGGVGGRRRGEIEGAIWGGFGVRGDVAAVVSGSAALVRTPELCLVPRVMSGAPGSWLSGS